MATLSISPQNLKETHYNTKEAAQLLGVETDTVKRYCNADPQRLRGRKLFGIEGPWLIPKSAIDEYLAGKADFGRPKKAHADGQRKK